MTNGKHWLNLPTAIVLGALSTGWAYSDEMADKLAQAYEAGKSAGYTEGWNACEAAHCGASVGGTVNWGNGAGNTMGYQFPTAFLGGGNTMGNVTLPEGWLIDRTMDGPGLLGKVDDTGIFQPYVTDNTGKIDLLPINEVPVWTTQDSAKTFFRSLAKGANGMVYIPVELATE